MLFRSGGFPITDLGPKFGFIGAGFWLGVPMAVWISGTVVGIFYIVLRHTTLGRYIYAVGGSETAAAFPGWMSKASRFGCMPFAVGWRR